MDWYFQFPSPKVKNANAKFYFVLLVTEQYVICSKWINLQNHVHVTMLIVNVSISNEFKFNVQVGLGSWHLAPVVENQQIMEGT